MPPTAHAGTVEELALADSAVRVEVVEVEQFLVEVLCRHPCHLSRLSLPLSAGL
jgi:hypothetical protein